MTIREKRIAREMVTKLVHAGEYLMASDQAAYYVSLRTHLPSEHQANFEAIQILKARAAQLYDSMA